MGDPTGFLNVKRVDNFYRPTELRVLDYAEIEQLLPSDERKLQAARCMDCGIPFCHWGCPVSNLIPEWQHKLFNGDLEAAYQLLQKTNNFPEFTGRICPAPCEASCVLEINNDAVTIRANELDIIEQAFQAGYVQPKPPKVRSGKKVAVIGSGPAGLACADDLNKMGHTVVLYEAADAVGGYLRYGIPDFKLSKSIIDRRVEILQAEGLLIETGVEIGKDISGDELLKAFDVVAITIGAREPRVLPIEGCELDGIHFAVEYLTQQNMAVAGEEIPADKRILATDKHLIVIGGGDTGADCVGTANRQGAKSVTQLEILPKPPDQRASDNPWPHWAKTHRTSTSHKEGCRRHFSVNTKNFIGEKGKVQKLITAKVIWNQDENGRYQMSEIPNTEKEYPADLILLAMGFVQVVKTGLVTDLGLELTERGNISVDDNNMTNIDGVFAAGDAQRGASLVVWAIHEGKETAQKINSYLLTDVTQPKAKKKAQLA
ncbi:MAG: glutamate synthase subunit beta [Anaerolineales bacterium]|nr:glutamate synthase subunit beta [Anaerolineales bacterium]